MWVLGSRRGAGTDRIETAMIPAAPTRPHPVPAPTDWRQAWREAVRDPRDLLEIAQSICSFHEQPLALTEELIAECARRFFGQL